jgi:hypothetical protein
MGGRGSKGGPAVAVEAEESAHAAAPPTRPALQKSRLFIRATLPVPQRNRPSFLNRRKRNEVARQTSKWWRNKNIFSVSFPSV